MQGKSRVCGLRDSAPVMCKDTPELVANRIGNRPIRTVEAMKVAYGVTLNDMDGNGDRHERGGSTTTTDPALVDAKYGTSGVHIGGALCGRSDIQMRLAHVLADPVLIGAPIWPEWSATRWCSDRATTRSTSRCSSMVRTTSGSTGMGLSMCRGGTVHQTSAGYRLPSGQQRDGSCWPTQAVTSM